MSRRLQVPFDLAALEVFVAVCEGGTMAAGARLVGLTQPAVSLAIGELERQLKVRLFDRKTRPITLTAAGALLRQRATSVISEARHAALQVQNARRGRLSSLRVGLVSSLARLLSAPLIRALDDAAEEIFFHFAISAAHAQALRTRQLDLFIAADDLADEIGLERWPILREPYVLVAPAALGSAELGTLARSHPFIRFSARSPSATEINRYLRRQGIEPRGGVHFDAPHALASVINGGLGWTITTPVCLMEAGVELSPGDVHRLPGTGLQRSLTLVCRQKELGSVPRMVAEVAVDALRTACSRQLGQVAPWACQAMVFGADQNTEPPRRLFTWNGQRSRAAACNDLHR